MYTSSSYRIRNLGLIETRWPSPRLIRSAVGDTASRNSGILPFADPFEHPINFGPARPDATT
jgi:hypothetical protein